ncbi:MAG: hypothetical protein AABW71_05175 [Nanoarchaeota archaeon]
MNYWDFCRPNGIGCPPFLAYSVPNNQQCPSGTNGLICIKNPGPISGLSQSNFLSAVLGFWAVEGQH